MYIAKGKTYDARQELKAVGFVWDANKKEWATPSYDDKKWEQFKSATYYGRGNCKRAQAVEIVEVTE